MSDTGEYRSKWWAGLLAVTLLTVGCEEAEIEQYTVSKGSQPIAAQDSNEHDHDHHGHDHAHDDAASPPASNDAPNAFWVVPEGWHASPEPRPMRLATFIIDDESGPVEAAVTVFPGTVGGLAANVNRWRGQIGLDPVDADAVESLTETFNSPGFEGHLLHLRGPTQHMLAASIYEPQADRTWFVRVVAAEAVAARVKPEVFAFARSFGTDR